MKPDWNGLEFVLAHMGEAIKARQRRKYVNWVLVTRLGAADWPTKRRTAELLLERMNPPLAQNGPPPAPAVRSVHVNAHARWVTRRRLAYYGPA